MKLIRSIIEKFREHRLKNMFPDLQEAFQVTTHLTVQEMSCLYQLAKDRNYVMEIGSYIGASACCFGAALMGTDSGKLLCIDTWKNDAMTEGSRDTWQEFLDNTASFKKYISPIRGLSADVVDQVAARVTSLDLLFFDGDHSYEGVKADWETYKVFLRTGSTVVFHDWGWAGGVKMVVEEDVMPWIRSFDSLPNMWWGVIK